MLTQQTDGHESWTTVGVSENIPEASYRALADDVRYKLLKQGLEGSGERGSRRDA